MSREHQIVIKIVRQGKVDPIESDHPGYLTNLDHLISLRFVSIETVYHELREHKLRREERKS